MFNKIFLLTIAFAPIFFSQAMEKAPTSLAEPTFRLIEEYERPEPFKIYRYADVIFDNKTGYPITIQPIKRNKEYGQAMDLEPGWRKPREDEEQSQNLDLIEKFEVYYQGQGSFKSVLTITTDELKFRLDQIPADRVRIEIHLSWSGYGFGQPKYIPLPEFETRAEREMLEGSVVRLEYSLSPQEEKRILFEELGILQNKILTPLSQPHEVLGIDAPPLVHSLEELKVTNPGYPDKLSSNYKSLKDKVAHLRFVEEQELKNKGINRPISKLLQIVRSARGHIAEQVKLD